MKVIKKRKHVFHILSIMIDNVIFTNGCNSAVKFEELSFKVYLMQGNYMSHLYAFLQGWFLALELAGMMSRNISVY
jgi:hypothetical protein